MGDQLTPAQRRYVALLDEGYSIRLRRAWREAEGGLTWRPALYDPAGEFVRMVRLDVARKLHRLGYLRSPARKADDDESADKGE